MRLELFLSFSLGSWALSAGLSSGESAGLLSLLKMNSAFLSLALMAFLAEVPGRELRRLRDGALSALG